MRSTQRAGLTASFLNVPSKRIYYTGRQAFVEVFRQVDADHYERWESCGRGRLRRPRCWYPELKRFYAAIPKLVILVPPIPQSKEATIEEAKILVYDVIP